MAMLKGNRKPMVITMRLKLNSMAIGKVKGEHKHMAIMLKGVSKPIAITPRVFHLVIMQLGTKAQANGHQFEGRVQAHGHHIEGKSQAHGHHLEHFAKRKREIADAINYLTQEVLDAEKEEIEKEVIFPRRKREIIAALLAELV